MKVAALILLSLCGCTTRTFYNEDGKPIYTHRSFFTSQSIGELTATSSNGVIVVRLKSYANDQVSAIRETKELLSEVNKLKTP